MQVTQVNVNEITARKKKKLATEFRDKNDNFSNSIVPKFKFSP
jgi:hypothetical protein